MAFLFQLQTPVYSSPKGECSLLQEHNERHMKRRRNRLHHSVSIFWPAALCLWDLKINNNKAPVCRGTSVALVDTSNHVGYTY